MENSGFQNESEKTMSKLNSNQLKLIAMISMTIDHLISVLYPNYPDDWWIIFLHIIGRLAAPIFWFFLVEGYYHTRNIRKYAARLLLFAVIGHFAYNFAFGIPYLPFQTSVFNQTSVLWALFWGLAALVVNDSERLRQWQKTIAILVICALTFCADWSCIAVLAILQISENRGDFKRQMTGMLCCVAMYAAVYMIFIDPIYGVLQMGVALTIPLLKRYNGERGSFRGMKWLFYIYYPAHLVLCGIIRIALYGNIGVMIGG